MSMSNEDEFKLYQAATTNSEHLAPKQDSASGLVAGREMESYEFMMQDGDELVDLDALFDALNVVAKENVDLISYSLDPDQEGGTITVSNKALESLGMPSNLDDLNAVTSDTIKETVISDES